MRKRAWLCVLLIFSTMCLATACKRQYYSHKQTNEALKTLEVIFKRGQICYAMPEGGEDRSMYVFSAAGQSVLDQEENVISNAELKPGMLVDIAYDGYILETYPMQFSGIDSIRIKETHANNVDFLFNQINGMFPSTKPSDNTHWEILFEGDDFLGSAEKIALEYFLKETWTGASVTVAPDHDMGVDTGTITLNFSDVTTNSLNMDITINANDEETKTPRTKKTHAILQGCTWMTV